MFRRWRAQREAKAKLARITQERRNSPEIVRYRVYRAAQKGRAMPTARAVVNGAVSVSAVPASIAIAA